MSETPLSKMSMSASRFPGRAVILTIKPYMGCPRLVGFRILAKGNTATAATRSRLQTAIPARTDSVAWPGSEDPVTAVKTLPVRRWRDRQRHTPTERRSPETSMVS